GPTSAPQTVGDYVEAYEAARARDGYADIPAFLPHPDDALCLAVLRELVRVELECSWERGRPRRLEDYRISFPQLFTDPESLQLITFEEFRLRFLAGERPSPAEYERRFGVDTSAWPPLRGGSAAEGESVRRLSNSGGGSLRVTHRVAVGEPLAPARLSAPSSALGTPSQTPVGDGQSVPGPDVNGPGLSHEQTDAWSEFCRTVPRAAERLDRAAARMPRPGDRFLN